MSFRDAPLAVIHDRDKAALFTPEVRAAIDAHVAKYPAEWKQSAVMPALTLVQDWNGGWLSRELMDDVAAYLDMPAISVYEVASFYGMYDLAPTAKHKVCVKEVECLGACKDAPAVMVGKTYHEKLTPEALDKLIEGLD